MTFYLSKYFWLLFNPFNFLILLIFLTYIFKFFHLFILQKITFVTLFLLFLISTIMPTGSYLNYLLERDFHNSIEVPEKLDGILILSGATNPYLTREYNQISLGSSSERLIEAINIIKKKPDIKVIFSGGPAYIQYPNLTDSYGAKKFFIDMKIDITKIIFEEKSRNTYENILFSKNIINPKKNENWMVISSASHLKRVLNVAENFNWHLIPYATDFNYSKKYNFNLSFNLFSNLSQFQRAAHEWIGLIYYYLSGKSKKI